MRLPLFGLLSLLPATVPQALAQVIPQPDSITLDLSAARAALSYWEATSHGTSEQSVYLKNNSKDRKSVV